MTLTDAERRSNVGAYWALASVFGFSLNDVLVKLLSGDYALYQLMFARSIVGIAFVAFLIAPFFGSLGDLRTRRLGLHVLRGLAVVFANFCFFLALATLRLADAVAIFFVSPLIITVLSVVFLKERVGPRRWLAVFVGLAGVLIVLRPGTEAFQPTALLPVLAACGYAALHILTRKIGGTENAIAMAFYIQCTFLAVSCAAGLAFGSGYFDVFDHPSATFLFRAWTIPETRDLVLMAGLGVCTGFAGFCISQAYRRSEAALVAPFEYAALPLAVIWGLLIFDEWPDGVALLGISIVMTSGLVLIWREAVARRRMLSALPKRL